MGNFQSSSQPKNANAKSATCYYELLSLSPAATQEEIKKAYRRKALQLHPDKNIDNSEESHELFSRVQAAYEVLSDVQERAWYDRHKHSILNNRGFGDDRAGGVDEPNIDDLMMFFQPSAYKGFGDDNGGFFAVFRNLFEYLEDFENDEELMMAEQRKSKVSRSKTTSFGSKNSPYEPSLRTFYDKWTHFSSQRTFFGIDKYQPTFQDNRRLRRAMHKENSKHQNALRREFSETVRALATFVRKRDPRWKAFKAAKEEERLEAERLRAAREKQLRSEQIASYQEPEWSQIQDDQFMRAVTHHGSCLSEDEFILDDDSKNENVSDLVLEGETEFYCTPCKKSFKSLSQWRNHEKSKKHKSTLSKLGFDPQDVVGASECEEKVEANMTDHKLSQSSDSEEETFSDPREKVAKDDDSTGPTSPPPTHQEKKASRRRKPRRKKLDKQMKKLCIDDPLEKCTICKATFPSRNKLFDHLKSAHK